MHIIETQSEWIIYIYTIYTVNTNKRVLYYNLLVTFDKVSFPQPTFVSDLTCHRKESTGVSNSLNDGSGQKHTGSDKVTSKCRLLSQSVAGGYIHRAVKLNLKRVTTASTVQSMAHDTNPCI